MLTLSIAKQFEIYRGLEEKERIILEEEIENRKNNQDQFNKMTYFGQRIHPHDLMASKNMYDIIKWMNMGNLSQLSKIPDYYMKCFLSYIIQVSRAMSYAHKNNLIHGQFDLSRVLV